VILRDVTDRKQAEANRVAELNKFQALYDLAVAMTAQRSLDENLSLVVEKGRKLLGTDTSFIALRDEMAGDVYMHTLSGVNTEAFKRMRTPFGEGLGGKVANTGKGYIVEDYFQEIEKLHHDIACAEGLISGIAVPVQIGQMNLGVLYIFNRTKTSFSKSDLDALSLLGNLVAVEITRKRAEEGLRKAHDDLELRVDQRTAELEEVNEALKRENAEREAAEVALRESEERYRSLIENLPIGLYRNTPGSQGRFIMANPAVAEMHGYETADEFLQKLVADLYWNPADRQAFSEKLIAQGQVVSEELQLKKVDGTPFWGAVTVNVVRDESGEIKYFDGLVEDISDRKRVEEALEVEKRRFQTLLEFAPLGIVMIGKDNTWEYINPKFKEMLGWEYINPKFKEMLGYDLKDVPNGKQWFKLAYPDPDYRRQVISAWTEKVDSARAGGEFITVDFKVRCKDGTEKVVLFKRVLLHTGDHLLTCEDITELKQTMEELRIARREATELSEFLKKMFGRYLAREVMDSLLEDPTALELGGERRIVTIMMTDLRGFTAVTERLEPEQVVRMLNNYFEVMVEVIHQYHGTINEIVGDSLLVIFGAPQEVPDRAQKAIACAIAMQNAMAQVNSDNSALGLPGLEMGIALHDTEVIVGNIGSSKRIKYSVVGSGVNLVSRIESYTVGGQILVSESVRKEAGEILRIDEQREVLPKGTEDPLRIYEIGGIAGNYSLALEGREPALLTLARQIPIRYRMLEGKDVGKKGLEGSILRLSKKSAEVALDAPVKILTNLKMNLGDVDEKLAARDFYGKVIERSGENGQTHVVRFTSVPPEVDAYFQALRQYAAKEMSTENL
jgi:PAS domain S-box-containing protein